MKAISNYVGFMLTEIRKEEKTRLKNISWLAATVLAKHKIITRMKFKLVAVNICQLHHILKVMRQWEMDSFLMVLKILKSYLECFK